MTTTQRPTESHPSNAHPRLERVLAAIAERSFCTLASVSPAGRPHVAGVVYAAVDDELYVSTDRGSRKARNIAANPHVAICIPVRRLPVGLPASIQFQATAEILEVDHPDVRRLVAAGRIGAITGHGELELDDGCVVRIAPAERIATYGLGLSLRTLIKEPLNAGATLSRC